MEKERFAMEDGEFMRLTYGKWMDIPITCYPNGEPVAPRESVWNDGCILMRPKSLQSFMVMRMWMASIPAPIRHSLTVFVPCLIGARQDRETEANCLPVLHLFLKDIEAMGVREVVTLDPHSPASYLPNLKQMHLHVVAERLKAMRDPLAAPFTGVVAPDAGAGKRAEEFGKVFDVPVYHAWKRRDTRNGTLSNIGIEPVSDGYFLVVDDICDGGATFLAVADLLKRCDCAADLYVSHGLFTKGTEALLKAFGFVYTTNSTIGDKPGVHVIDVFGEGA